MSKKNTQLPILTSVQAMANLNINQNDVVQIIVSEVEERLISERDDLLLRITDIDKEIKVNEEKVVTEFTNASAKALAVETQTIATAIKSFTKEKEITSSYLYNECTEDKNKGKVEYHSAITSGRSRVTSRVVTASVPAIVTATRTKLDNLDKTQEANYVRLRHVKSELNNITRYERQAKARLAKVTLDQSTDGKALINDIMQHVVEGNSFLSQLQISK